ncbi:MAG: LptF/LptG family permease, partial [Lewinella sp.]|nr:LptF/LptG family permease [Lewinella sp.]
MFKKVDRLMLVSFFPPFLVTFGIATFVLLMQILWVYIDDIAGKGLGFFMIVELLSYKCVGLVPMAMPLAILLSSVMVMGGMAERYELSSFKSAGVRLLRVMRPIIIFGMFAMVVSYLCSDYIIPVANLKFGSRMYDIQQKKPALSLEQGIFNDDFGNYAIRIGEKEGDGKTIHHVLIYDHTDANSNKLAQVMAERGEMYSTPDGNYFIMHLENGHQYTEMRPSGRRSAGEGYPFVRINFGTWTKVFDLSEFDLSVTNEQLFEGNRSMMSIRQLAEAIDSIQAQIDRRYVSLTNHVASYYTPFSSDILEGIPDTTDQATEAANQDSLDRQDEVAAESSADDSLQAMRDTFRVAPVTTDSLAQPLDSAGVVVNAGLPVPPKPRPLTDGTPPRARTTPVANRLNRDTLPEEQKLPIERFTDTVASVDAWLASLDISTRRRYIQKATSAVRSRQSQAESAVNSIDRTMENKVKHIYEMHMKYSMAVVCIIFVFVGAPLGAIVRKGGFGY